MPYLFLFIFTASIESGSIILHDQASDAILEWFIELAETSNNKIDEVIDVLIGFLFAIGGIDAFLGGVLADAEEVVDCVVHDLHDLFRDEFFLS